MGAALVMDTCGDRGYVAVCAVGAAEPRVVSARHLAVRATQEELLPAAASALDEAGMQLGDVSAIAVVSGPGSFTGVRIGLATAKGLCEAAGLRLVLLSRLAVLAEAAGSLPVWAWLQAGRGDVYAAHCVAGDVCKGDGRFYGGREGEHGELLTAEQALVNATSEPIAVLETSLLGVAPNAFLVSDVSFQQALCAAAARATTQNNGSDVALSDALYLRVPDAEQALRAGRA